MQIRKTAEDRYHVEVNDSFIDEDVNGSQLLGMTSGRTTPTGEEILRALDLQPTGHTITVDYKTAL